MIVDTEKLCEALEVTKFGVAKKSIIDSMESYGFYDGHICTCNDRIAIKHWSPINNVNADINAKALQSILKESQDAYLNIYCSESTLHIDGKATSAIIPISNSSHIQSYMREVNIPPSDSDKWNSLSHDFKQLAQRALFTKSNNMARPNLTCMHWDNDILETTDNYAITRCTLTTNHPQAESVLIPGESAAVLLKFDPIAFVCAGDWLHFKTKQDAIFSCRTFQGVFPELGGCLSKKCTTFIEFPPSFSAILKRASKITPKDRYLEKEAKVCICNGQLTVQVQVGENGKFQESCPIDFKDSLIFSVDPDRLKQLLDQNGNHVVGFTTHTEGKAGVLRFESDNVVQMLIVTLR